MSTLEINQYALSLARFVVEQAFANEERILEAQSGVHVHNVLFDVDGFDYAIQIESGHWFGEFEHTFSVYKFVGGEWVLFVERVDFEHLSDVMRGFFNAIKRRHEVLSLGIVA